MVSERALSIFHFDADEEDHEIFKAALLQVAPLARLTYIREFQALLAALAQDPLPDIVFLDLNIRLIGEQSYVGEIRSHPHLRHLPLIIYSSHTHHHILRTCHEDGANLYMLKQANFGILKRMIHSALTRDLKSPSLEEFVLNSD